MGNMKTSMAELSHLKTLIDTRGEEIAAKVNSGFYSLSSFRTVYHNHFDISTFSVFLDPEATTQVTSLKGFNVYHETNLSNESEAYLRLIIKNIQKLMDEPFEVNLNITGGK